MSQMSKILSQIYETAVKIMIYLGCHQLWRVWETVDTKTII